MRVSCPLCGTSNGVSLGWLPDRLMGRPGRFEYARCAACGLAYLRERPPDEALGGYYPPGYIREGRGPAFVRRALRAWDLAPKARLAGQQVSPRPSTGPGRPRLLDVGCARGDFLIEMRRRGFIVAGIEPTLWLAEAALAAGLPVWPSTLADAAVPSRAFDLVTMWDVLEHLPDPVAALRRIADLLRPGGRLVVNTPLEDGWDARWLGQRWPGWDAPRHLAVFSHRTLADALTRAGFRVVGGGRVFETYLIIAMAAGLWSRERLPAPLADVVWAALHARPTRLLATPIFAVLDRLLGGSSVAVVAEL